MMFKTLAAILEAPPLYTKTEVPFWDDEHISSQMLKAHLDPNMEAASRKLAFIDQSANWISEIVPSSQFRDILDIGCGPGIYAEKFAQGGYQVTGIDFSRRSVSYAIESAKRKGLNIRYICQDYLHMDLNRKFDFAAMIYCDYGALSTADRRVLMEKIYRHLKPGGKFLFDVFSVSEYNRFEEKRTWEICHDGGFWRKEHYIAFNGCYRYPNYVTLKQTSVFSEQNITTYYIWNTCFTKETLIREAMEAGFKVCDVFSDVVGNIYCEDSPTLAILLEK